MDSGGPNLTNSGSWPHQSSTPLRSTHRLPRLVTIALSAASPSFSWPTAAPFGNLRSRRIALSAFAPVDRPPGPPLVPAEERRTSGSLRGEPWLEASTRAKPRRGEARAWRAIETIVRHTSARFACGTIALPRGARRGSEPRGGCAPYAQGRPRRRPGALPGAPLMTQPEASVSSPARLKDPMASISWGGLRRWRGSVGPLSCFNPWFARRGDAPSARLRRGKHPHSTQEHLIVQERQAVQDLLRFIKLSRQQNKQANDSGLSF
jgi:hypothetical protein